MQVKREFSLVEWIIVVSIIGALSLIALLRIMKGATIAKSNACKTNVMVLNLQMRLYYANEGEWPSSFNALINDPNYFPDGPPKCPFGNPYTMHSSNHWINQHSH
jgi:competence protein ComGC